MAVPVPERRTTQPMPQIRPRRRAVVAAMVLFALAIVYLLARAA
jgi:hypothetical protein